MKLAFVVNDLQLSGGVGVIVHHARNLAQHHGIDVTLVLAREQEHPHWGYTDLDRLHIATVEEARETEFDLALSTWWETVHALFLLRAGRYGSFVQSLEDRFYTQDAPERLLAPIMLDLPLAFITEARWIRDTLADLRPDTGCKYVRNGIDKLVFGPVDEIDRRPDDEPLRILVEGYASTWFKGVNEAIWSVGLMQQPHHLTVVAPDRTGLDGASADVILDAMPQRDLADLYQQTDVVLKLSRVEGMYGPPLEGFHRGATCVTTEVTGHEEYIRHGENALVVDWDDLAGTARQLDLLARDRAFLTELREGALATAREWPSWEQSSDEFAAAVREIVAEPAPDPYGHVPALLADVRSATERSRIQLQERNEALAAARRLEQIKSMPAVRTAMRVKSHPIAGRAIGRARTVARRVKR